MAVSNPYVIPLPWKNMLLVLGGSLALWSVPWLAWPFRAQAAGREPVRKPPVFRYVKAVQGLEGSTWSPVLMPLPTAEGFSKMAALHEIPRKTPVEVMRPRVTEPLYLDLQAPAVPSFPGVGLASPESRGFEPDGLGESVFGARPASQGSGIQVEITGRLKDRSFEAQALGGIMVPATEFASVSATAYVEISRLGLVGRVLLEQPSGVAAVDAALVKGLWTGKGMPGEGPASGHVRVFFWKSEEGKKD
jgi:hypothetical protein